MECGRGGSGFGVLILCFPVPHNSWPLYSRHYGFGAAAGTYFERGEWGVFFSSLLTQDIGRQVQDSLGQSAVAQLLFSIQAPPFGGTLLCTPNGIAFDTVFTITSTPWTTTAAPLSFSFFRLDIQTNESYPLSSVTYADPLWSGQLPIGNPDDGNLLTLGVIATDSLGSSSIATCVVQSNVPETVGTILVSSASTLSVVSNLFLFFLRTFLLRVL